MVLHEDAHGMVAGEMELFWSASDAERWAAGFSDKLPKGHALVLYECRELRTLAEQRKDSAA
jgi:hypothetical protein